MGSRDKWQMGNPGKERVSRGFRNPDRKVFGQRHLTFLQECWGGGEGG